MSNQSVPQIFPLRRYSTRKNGKMSVESVATWLPTALYSEAVMTFAESCERRYIQKALVSFSEENYSFH